MNRHLTLAAAAAALLLSACGSSNEPAKPTVKVSDLAAGMYAVSAGDSANPTAGRYYSAADGSRLLVLNNSAQQATALYRRDAGGSWQMTPAATQDTSLELLNSSSLQSATLNFTAVARSYTVRLSSGAAAAFSVNANGEIVAGSTSCKLSGKLAASSLPNTLKATLSASSCGDLPAQSDGYLVVDSDYAPAAFRLLTYSGSTPLDLWAYAE
ncbi:hypothetical protein SAMN05216319_0481 [Duganella sp. CF402]|uniref:hypothetical protein n=1 Tax=unclassified Duganella TaxID=2636909 RepID=UPI0008AD1F0B|nr:MULTISPECIES: hypothetical protein [unclassified Duganella]RZT11049.1 hypothetical protein EV582_3145 [Duganella sp. BK701]SEK83947.1 hypothetical protein SAMN05216319_0481 [Duganella sp. CF402]